MYMVVTNDEFELPLGVFDTREEVAEHMHLSVSAVVNRVYRGSKRSTTEKIILLKEPRTKAEREKARKEYEKQYRREHDRREYFRQYYQKKKERKNNEQRIGTVKGSCKDA